MRNTKANARATLAAMLAMTAAGGDPFFNGFTMGRRKPCPSVKEDTWHDPKRVEAAERKRERRAKKRLYDCL